MRYRHGFPRAAALAVTLALTAVAPRETDACTGFAAYDERPIYGTNFDYPSHFQMKLFVDQSGDVKTFALAFIREGRPVRTVGMNSLGLFGSVQELHPLGGGKSDRGRDELFVWEVVWPPLSLHDSVDEAVAPLDSRRLVQHEAVRLHALLADASGRAVVVEPGDDGNELTWIDGDFIVMTNFCVADFAGRPPEDARGVGADRYRTAHEMLSERGDEFGFEDAMEVLEATAWHWTRASMVFDPTEGIVYLALEGDYSKIYCVTLATSVVETHRGHEEHQSWPVPRWGLPTTVLSGETEPSFIDRIWAVIRRVL